MNEVQQIYVNLQDDYDATFRERGIDFEAEFYRAYHVADGAPDKEAIIRGIFDYVLLTYANTPAQTRAGRVFRVIARIGVYLARIIKIPQRWTR